MTKEKKSKYIWGIGVQGQTGKEISFGVFATWNPNVLGDDEVFAIGGLFLCWQGAIVIYKKRRQEN